MPFAGRELNRDLFRFSYRSVAFLIGNPGYFRQPFSRVSFINLEALRIAKACVYSLLFEFWKLRRTFKVVLVFTVKIFELLFKNLKM